MRRRSYRGIWYAIGVVFVAVFLFTFLTHNYKKAEEVVEAVSLVDFDPGYIISDYTMSNYNSMSETDIQNFLNANGNCKDTRTYLAQQYSGYSYHIRDGHFVCLAEEIFGDGEAYGENVTNGQTAAHIIWQAAQDYKINPQVLIVLLQKEQSLITDSWPNSIQFRSATGYGCPDTAPCSSEYYGFKNQVRKAAALFRAVLNGGWTNYPLGNNYIQYNPNASCGGSVVNIQSLATSALYRYTPYQPNAGALAAGYGTADCGAYGNRNFYLYFQDWFGGIRNESSYRRLDSPRYFELIKDTQRISSRNNEIVDTLPAGMIRKFDSKIQLNSGEWCLRTEYGTAINTDACIRMTDLKEIELLFETINEEKIIKPDAKKILIRSEESVMNFSDYIIRNFTRKTTFLGEEYYVTEYDEKNGGSEYGIPTKYLLDSYEQMDKTEPYILADSSERINPFTEKISDTLEKGRIIRFSSKILIDDKEYYRTEYNTINKSNVAILKDNLVSLGKFEPFDSPREMKLMQDVDRVNPFTGEVNDRLVNGRVIKFSSKVYVDGVWYYRTEYNTINYADIAIPSWAVGELNE